MFKNRLNPSLGLRLACWFGVYLCSQLPLYVGGLIPWNRFPILIWYFPLGLWRWRWFLGFYGCYAVFLLHLGLSIFWPGRKAFIRLILVLIAACALSLVGCEKTLRDLKEHPPLWDYSDMGGSPPAPHMPLNQR